MFWKRFPSLFPFSSLFPPDSPVFPELLENQIVKPISMSSLEDIDGVEADIVTVCLVSQKDGAVGVVQQLDFEEPRP